MQMKVKVEVEVEVEVELDEEKKKVKKKKSQNYFIIRNFSNVAGQLSWFVSTYNLYPPGSPERSEASIDGWMDGWMGDGWVRTYFLSAYFSKTT